MKKFVLFCCFCIVLGGVFGQVKLWSGPNNGLWSNAANWTPAGLPGAGDTVIFNSNNQCHVDVNSTIAAIRALGAGMNNNLFNPGAAKTITISSNPVSSPVLYVEAGSFFSLATPGSAAGISITTYGAAATTNTAIVDGFMSFGYFSSWNTVNGTAITNADISGTIHVAANNTAANIFPNSTVANLRFLSGSFLLWAKNGGYISDADYQNGSTITMTGIIGTMATFSGTANYNGLIILNNAGQTVSGSSAVLLPTASYAMDSIRVMNTGTGTLRITSEPAGYTLGHVEVQGGILEMGAPVLGNRSGTISTDLKISGGTVYGNATFSGDLAGVYATTLAINGKLTMTGGTLDLTNRPLLPSLFGACQINVGGDVSQTGSSIITASSDFGSQNILGLTGSAPQNLTMSTFSGPMVVTIANTSTAGVALLSTLTIPALPAVLSLITGIVTPSGANLLIMQSGSLVVGGSAASFINGKVRKFGNTAFTFPIGGINGSYIAYAPLEISATAGPATDNFTADYRRSTAEIYPVTNVGINHVSRVDYWVLDRAGSTNPVDVRFYWTASSSNNGSPNYINNLNELIVAYSNGTSWMNFSGLGTYGASTTTAGSLIWTGLTNTWGPFSLGSITFGNPLPINLNYINGVKQGSANFITWKVTCTNNPNAVMSLERSADNRNFKDITTVTADALRCLQPFDHVDAQPLSGINYYRLKMTDAYGKVTYSSVIAIMNKANGFDIVGLMPTLVNSKAILNVTAAQKTTMQVVITDIAGRQVQKINYNLIAGSNQFPMELSTLTAGTYQITGYIADGTSKTIRFVKQ